MSTEPRVVEVEGGCWAVQVTLNYNKAQVFLRRSRDKYNRWSPDCECTYCRRNPTGRGVYYRSQTKAEEVLALYLLRQAAEEQP